jgi:dihydroorotate dehydrogenase (NAD+) catalytic subunit
MLEVNLSGLNLKSPLILASGILGVSSSIFKRIIDAGAGAITTKSIGPSARKGYRNPSIIELSPGTFLNSVGLANPGVNEFIKEIHETKKYNVPLIVSIFGNDLSSYIEVAKKVTDAGADALELNISCPHAEVSCIGIDKNLTFSLISGLKKKIKIPLFIKLNPNVTNVSEIALAAESAGADAVVAINTVKAMVIDIETGRPILSHGSGGLSGKAIHPIAVNAVYDLFKVLNIPIIACGGLDSWKDVIEFFLAGASAVQIGSALYKGIEIISQIQNDLKNYLKKAGIASINQLKGLSHNYEIQEVPDFD